MTTYSRSRILALITSALIGTYTAASDATTFNSSFLHDFRGGSPIDISQFESGDLSPGTFPLDIYINGKLIEQRIVDLVADINNGSAVKPCLTRKTLMELNPLLDKSQEKCIDLPAVIPGAKVKFSPLSLRVDIDIPNQAMEKIKQSALRHNWDDGINALIANYQLSLNRTAEGSQFASNAQVGLNIGAWRLRTDLAYTAGGDASNNVGSQAAQFFYAYRQIPDLDGQLIAGNALAGGLVLGTNRIYGLQFHTDNDMAPNAMPGMRPHITGIARGNAVVTVLQGGSAIYTHNVPPGSFVIDDLPVLLSNQDLTVRVEESDGKTHEFTQPIAVLPSMRAAGESTWQLAMGQAVGAADFKLISLQYSHGLMNGRTFNTEVVAGNQYVATSMGLTQQIGRYGAVEADLASANYDDGVNRSSGASIRALWANSILATATDFKVIGALHDSPGFMDMNDAIALSANPVAGRDFVEKNALQAQIAQRLSSHVSLNLNFSEKTAWNTSETEQTNSVSASFGLGRSMLSLAFDQTKGASIQPDRRITLQWQLPLGIGKSGGRSSVSYTHQTSESEGPYNQLSMSGVAGAQQQYRYSASLADGASGGQALYVGYINPWGNASVSISHGLAGMSGGLSYGGGLALHNGGLTFGQQLGESAGLIYTGGVAGVSIVGQPNVVSDKNGYALVPWLSPFRENQLLLDPHSGSDSQNVEIENMSKILVPSRGAIVRTDFQAHRGYMVLLGIKRKNGQFVPLGSRIELSHGKDSWVGQSGMSYFLSDGDEGEGDAIWFGHRCHFSYRLEHTTSLQRQETTCNE